MDGTYVEKAPRSKWTSLILGFWGVLALYFLLTELWVWLLIVAVNLATEIYNTRARSRVSYAATGEALEIRTLRKVEVEIPYGDILALRKYVSGKRTRAILSSFDVYRQPKAYPAAGLGAMRWLLLYRDQEDGRDLPIFFEPSRQLRDLLRRRIYAAIEASPEPGEPDEGDEDGPEAAGPESPQEPGTVLPDGGDRR